MTSRNRTRRIAEEIKKVISKLLIDGIKDPRINTMVSVTDVEVTNDLRYAFTYVSILSENKEEVLEGLKHAGGFIRRQVGKEIKLRYIPEIVFKIDDSLDRGMYMDELIKKISKHDMENNSSNEEVGE